MDKSKISKSEVCQMCARCCKSYSEICYNFDLALRLSLLDTDKIIVKEFTLENGNKGWRITYKFPCNKLIKKRDGKYHCELWDKQRPCFCETYPSNMSFEDSEIEKEYCPLLKEVVKNGYISNNTTK